MQLIQFTDRAIEAIQQYQQTLHIPIGNYLRVGIRQKNETNKRLLIGFDEKGEKDKFETVQGIELIYHPGEIFFFAGMVIDYVEETGRKGFTFVEKAKQV
jgi:Fe-S cluster assembly iron-binding protein IscA